MIINIYNACYQAETRLPLLILMSSRVDMFIFISVVAVTLLDIFEQKSLLSSLNIIYFYCSVLFRPQGCTVTTFQSSRLSHQTVCEFRPVECQYSGHGCQVVLAVKVGHITSVLTNYDINIFILQDIPWHHKHCEYAQIVNVNVSNTINTEIPDMPTRKKSSMKLK